MREDLVDEGIITGRDSQCGNWINPERFPPSPIKIKCDTYFCPVCGFEKVMKIKNRVSHLSNQFQRDGGILYLLTFTIPHDHRTDLKDMYRWYSQSIRKLKNSSVWRNRLKKDVNFQMRPTFIDENVLRKM